jgi:hypothetical protein
MKIYFLKQGREFPILTEYQFFIFMDLIPVGEIEEIRVKTIKNNYENEPT